MVGARRKPPIVVAQYHSDCPVCRGDLMGRRIAKAVDGKGWCHEECLRHLTGVSRRPFELAATPVEDGTPSTISPTTVARYPGTCHVCGTRYTKGTRVVLRRYRWVHAWCVM